MQRATDGLLFSPSDLVEFMESPFASWMSRYAVDHPESKPDAALGDPTTLPGVDALLKRRGTEHERAVLDALRAAGRDVLELDSKVHDSRAQTLAALRAGREVIYQATLAHGRFAGIADFLVRVPGASKLGGFHYEVWDAKLARRAKPTHAIQLCGYAQMLAAIQGLRAAEAQLELAGGRRERLRIDDFLYFHRALERAFLQSMDEWDDARPPAPEPGAEHRRWQEAAERWLEDRDAVCRVAFVTKLQTRRLDAAGIGTLGALADTGLARVHGLEDRVLARLREQAALQRASAGKAPPLYRVLREEEVEEGRGLALLPPASPGDLILDLEGDPLEEGGLEYLWGTVSPADEGTPIYHSAWAHDTRGERVALEGFLDGLLERRAQHPDLHVYHYGAYELTALKRLAAREETREEALDVLLRAQVFVDLYPVVRHGVRVGEPGYSLKNVERLVRTPRAGELGSGMESVAVYDVWRQSGEGRAPAASKLLERIRLYNEEDCRSTLALLRWLRERQAEAGIAHRTPRPPAEGEAERGENEDWRRRRELAERMRAAIPESPDGRAHDAERWRIQAILAPLVEFHRREARPVWWELFERAAMDEAERAEQPDCLAGLQRTDRAPFSVKKSLGYEYAFDPGQDTKIRVGSKCRLAQLVDAKVEVAELDAGRGRLVLKISAAGLAKVGMTHLPERVCLIRFDHRDSEPMEKAIEAVAASFHESRELAPPLRDLLLRRPPRIRDLAGGPIRRSGETPEAAFQRAARDLDGSLLCVQGPPGSGKTTLGGKVIAALLRSGKKIGIASHSHKAISHMMTAVADATGERLDCVKIGGEEGDAPSFDGARHEDETANAAACLARVSLIGGTAWCFSRADLVGKLDYLFVDEAGQVSLANLVAMSRAARNLVLIGDPRQLDQPTRGSHPGESGLSALDYALAAHATVPPELGLFLADTHRLHPELCTFISGAFYEDRLQPAAGNERRVLEGEPAAGIAFVPVPHEGNRQGSDEEVAAIAGLVGKLVARVHRDREGRAKLLGEADVLVVAPYNLQVRKLEAALPLGVRVGTVDRFQGQEAPVVIVSMCASEPHLSARGIEFLFHPNRLNVAFSRAQTLAIVVGEPRLATAVCRSVQEMRLVNRMCRLLADARPF